jgi:hypothetical protein
MMKKFPANQRRNIKFPCRLFDSKPAHRNSVADSNGIESIIKGKRELPLKKPPEQVFSIANAPRFGEISSVWPTGWCKLPGLAEVPASSAMSEPGQAFCGDLHEPA